MSSTTQLPFQSTPFEASASPLRYSVHEYQERIRQGDFDVNSPVELIENIVVSKMPRNPKHDSTIQRFVYTLIRVCPLPWTVRSQSAIELPDSQPEPDCVIVRGSTVDFENRHPNASDIALVIEIANTSLLWDRKEKGRIYSRAGLPEYWLVNLVDNRIEVYTQPSGPTSEPAYASCEMMMPGQALPFILDGRMFATLNVSELLGFNSTH